MPCANSPAKRAFCWASRCSAAIRSASAEVLRTVSRSFFFSSASSDIGYSCYCHRRYALKLAISGCGGPQPPAGEQVAGLLLRDPGLNAPPPRHQHALTHAPLTFTEHSLAMGCWPRAPAGALECARVVVYGRVAP